MILLDTHAAYWMAGDSAALGRQSRQQIAEAQENGKLAVSAISFWELALLSSKRRITLNKTVGILRMQMLDTGIVELPLTGAIGISSVELQGLHSDPADRIIVATALAHDAALITADKQLLKWRGKLTRHDASK